MWPAVLADANVTAALAGRAELRQRTIRLWGTPESELAATLRDSDDVLAGLEITTCLRNGELEIVTRYGPDAQPAYDQLEILLQEAYPETLFSLDGATIDDVVRQTNRARSTAVEYLCKFLRAEPPASVSRWVSDDIYREVAQVAARLGADRLKPIFDALNGKYTYDEIRIVVTHLNAGGGGGSPLAASDRKQG